MARRASTPKPPGAAPPWCPSIRFTRSTALRFKSASRRPATPSSTRPVATRTSSSGTPSGPWRNWAACGWQRCRRSWTTIRRQDAGPVRRGTASHVALRGRIVRSRPVLAPAVLVQPPAGSGFPRGRGNRAVPRGSRGADLSADRARRRAVPSRGTSGCRAASSWVRSVPREGAVRRRF